MIGFIQQMINGLSIGSVYALMAVGYSLVYSIMNFSNFAHGGVIMIGSYIGFFCISLLNFSFPVAFVTAALGSGILAIIVERVAYNPLRKRNAPFLYFIPRFYVSTSKSIIKALINMRSFEIQPSPIG